MPSERSAHRERRWGRAETRSNAFIYSATGILWISECNSLGPETADRGGEETEREAGEEIDNHALPGTQALERAVDGRIQDAKSIETVRVDRSEGLANSKLHGRTRRRKQLQIVVVSQQDLPSTKTGVARRIPLEERVWQRTLNLSGVME